jgi:hypothetical protein
MVQQAWQCDVSGISPLNTLFYRLQNTSKASRSKKVFGNARLELHMVNEIIQRLDLAQENRQLTPEERALRTDLKNRVLGLEAIERSRRRQASKLIWLKEGDACTKFFHLKTNKRKRRNFIAYLKNSDGDYLWDQKSKELILQSYFEGIMGSREQRTATLNWEALTMPVLGENTLDAPH